MRNPYEWQGKLYRYVPADDVQLMHCDGCDLKELCGNQLLNDKISPINCSNPREYYIMKEIKDGNA